MQENYSYLVRSLDLAGNLQRTPHKTFAEARAQQALLRDECGHTQVVILPLETEVIELPTRGPVVAYREPEPTHRANSRKAVRA